MNTFIPENPTVILQVSRDGTAVIRLANNIDPNLKIVLVETATTFDDKALNQPFNNTINLGPQQVLSSAASKARNAVNPIVARDENYRAPIVTADGAHISSSDLTRSAAK
jgi:hypothetical protein